MQFPRWADGQQLKKAQRATGRLKFILGTLALKHTGRNSMRALGEKVGLDHSTLSKYIKAGAFSEPSASQIEVRLGPKEVRAEMLISPLSIPKTPD